MTLHDDDAWQPTVHCTDATALNVRGEMRISITLHDDDAWRTTICYTEATAREDGAKLCKNERKRAHHGGENEIKTNAKTLTNALMPMPNIRPCHHYHIQCKDELKIG